MDKPTMTVKNCGNQHKKSKKRKTISPDLDVITIDDTPPPTPKTTPPSNSQPQQAQSVRTQREKFLAKFVGQSWIEDFTKFAVG